MKKPATITNEQSDTIIQNLRLDDKAIACIALETGLRISDILSLKYKNINLKHTFLECAEFSVQEQKTKKIRHVKLSHETTTLLYMLQEKATNDYVFASKRKSKMISRVSFHRRLKQVANAQSINVSAHSFRKLYAQNIYAETKSIYQVQEALQHKYIETTLRYLDIDFKSLLSKNL